ncbi:MAG: hypothetical protein WC047_05245 [Kiritimatiellales bacterium]
MIAEAYRFYFEAVEARQSARLAMHSRLPGWRIYHRSALRRAIINWRRYAEIARDLL